jgi:probable F420-dependent oxidoreductase
MKFGLAFGSSIATEGSDALELCRRAEALGFDSVWGGEHVIRPVSIESKYPYTPDGVAPGDHDTPVPDPLIWLSYVAAAAPSLRLGTCILIVPQRNPLVLAKELATLDRLSGGRVELGIGVGWMKEEFDALDVPWERRGKRTDEYLAAMQALWAAPAASFHGEFVDFDEVTSSPRPENARIPILVGGDSPAAIKRAVRLGDGYFPGVTAPEMLATRATELEEACKEAGRDRNEISLHALFIEIMEPVAGVERFTSLGVERALVPAFFFAGDGGLERLEAFAEQAIAGGQ